MTSQLSDETMNQLITLSLDFQNPENIQKIDIFLEKITSQSPESILLILENSSSPNLTFALLNFMNKIFFKRIYSPNVNFAKYLWNFFIKKFDEIFANKICLKLFIELFAKMYIFLSQDVEVFDFINSNLEQMKNEIKQKNTIKPLILTFFQIFLENIFDIFQIGFFGDDCYSQFKTCIGLFRIKASLSIANTISFCIETSFQEIILNTNDLTANYLCNFLKIYLLNLNFDHNLQKNENKNESAYEIRKTNVPFTFPFKNIQNNENQIFLMSENLSFSFFSLLKNHQIRICASFSLIFEQILKIFCTFVSLPETVQYSPGFNQLLLGNQITGFMFEILEDPFLLEKIVESQQNKSSSQYFGFILVKILLFKNVFERIQNQDAAIFALYQKTSTILIENLKKNQNLSEEIFLDFCFYFYHVFIASPIMFQIIVGGQENDFFSFIIEYYVQYVKLNVICPENDLVYLSEILPKASEGICCILLSNPTPAFQTTIINLLKEFECERILAFIFFSKTLLNIFEKSIFQSNHFEKIEIFFKLSNYCFDILSSHLQHFNQSQVLKFLLLTSFSQIFIAFHEKVFSSNFSNKEVFLNQMPLFSGKQWIFLKLLYFYVATDCSFDKNNLNEKIWQAKTKCINKIFKYASHSGNGIIAINTLYIPDSEQAFLYDFRLDHFTLCNYNLFKQHPHEAERFYEPLTRIFCTLLKKDIDVSNAERNFEEFLKPLLQLFSLDFDYFVVVLKGITDGIKEGLESVLMKCVVNFFLEHFDTKLSENFPMALECLSCCLKKKLFDSIQKNQLEIYQKKILECIAHSLTQMDVLFSKYLNVSLSTNRLHDLIIFPANLVFRAIRHFIDIFKLSSIDLATFWQNAFEVYFMKHLKIDFFQTFISDFTEFFILLSYLISLTTLIAKTITSSPNFQYLMSILDAGLEATSFQIISTVLQFHIDLIKILRTKQDAWQNIENIYFNCSSKYLVRLCSKFVLEIFSGPAALRIKIFELLYEIYLYKNDIILELNGEMTNFSSELLKIDLCFKGLFSQGIKRISDQHFKEIKRFMALE